ncbi:barstar family protein [Streptomyces sp. NPDC054766]|uniref:barstar family protein n=1 Tax=Streptomyces rhizosphaerihabitans TaxID=1266770 RepID=UPI0021C0EF6F|nr:barstar family protein [Streptomyces rhizosphaerihabitans]MCT9010470.1 barstar family protein [Streptomyces rhizosphaerihabitans]WRZ92942.1 barstar family protein [Streptomyces sp. NBC_01007]
MLDAWVDVEERLPWLPLDPYFVGEQRHGLLVEELERSGFSVLEIDLATVREERQLKSALGRALVKPDDYADNWDALRDLLQQRGESRPWLIAIVFTAAHSFLRADVHAFVRSVAVLHSLAEELSNIDEPYGQLELFYVGDWTEA